MKTNYERNRVLDARYGDGSYSKPGTVYIALFTSAPTVSDEGTEVSGGAYARAAVTNNLGNFPDSVDGVKSNAAPIAFAQASSAWGTVTHGGIYDALTGGNLLDFAPLGAAKTIATNDTFSIPAGGLTLTET